MYCRGIRTDGQHFFSSALSLFLAFRISLSYYLIYTTLKKVIDIMHVLKLTFHHGIIYNVTLKCNIWAAERAKMTTLQNQCKL